MKLAIHTDLTNGMYNLTDLKLEPNLESVSFRYKTSEIQDSERFTVLFNQDQQQILNRLTENQFMVAAYFYLRNTLPSRELVSRWLRDAGCTPQLSVEAAELIYEASLSALGENYLTDVDEGYYNMNYLQLHTVLERLLTVTPIRWIFDYMPTRKSDGFTDINIANLRETLFKLEDHSCFIMGFGNSCSSLIELLYGYDTGLAENLCNIIPLGIRDRCSVGRALTVYPEVYNALSENGKRIMEYYGLDSNGVLRKYMPGQIEAFNLTTRHDNRYLPIYVRIYK